MFSTQAGRRLLTKYHYDYSNEVDVTVQTVVTSGGDNHPITIYQQIHRLICPFCSLHALHLPLTRLAFSPTSPSKYASSVSTGIMSMTPSDGFDDLNT